ncbi:hypothetical protein [Arthrobacter zhaoguopingii]|uniref:hypothetical protein n=1 Tax=Arthrobacter zhaoguopingii TaxID=2681491 RepID=UPI001358101F|nr:hypothetical protein [Arthrobacter zhaoguopingii]
MEDIKRAPRGRWEKLGFWLLVFPVVPTLVLSDILEAVGLPFWVSLLVTGLFLGIGYYLLMKPLKAERADRLASDLESGIFDCAIRFPQSTPGSLRDLWEIGVGRLQATTLLFQTRVEDEQGSPAGPVKTFRNAVLTASSEAPAGTPFRWQRDWKHVHLQTSGGLPQVAASEQACAFLEAELGSGSGGTGASAHTRTPG